jgi:hypothetical protein
LSEGTGEQPDTNSPDEGTNGNTSTNDDAAGAAEPTNQGDAPEAPVPAEPKPVEVSPADQSDVKTDKVFDKDYEVTPERGYRVQKPS